MAKPVLENNNNSNSNSKESVECVCKACGSKCSVSDPYNFSCGRCNVKYTSLPTHLIADPLQCIGCLQVFQHKPAMKEHQSSHDKVSLLLELVATLAAHEGSLLVVRALVL